MNVLVDVGAHVGETIGAAFDGRWRFDLVHSFEPDPECVREIERRYASLIESGKLKVHAVALGDRNGEVVLSGDNSGGAASVLPDFIREAGRAVRVPLVDINEFLDREIPRGARLYVKMNCEGGEVAILNRLRDRRDIADIASIMVDFDVVRKGGGYWEKRKVLTRARARGLPVVLAEHVMVGPTHVERIGNWLARFPDLAAGAPGTPVAQSLKRRFRYFVRDMRSALGGSGRAYR